jgi:hypothetical protein
VTVLFGGNPCGVSYSSETWEWDGIAWREAAISGPSPRAGYSMSYDSIRRETVIFGGWNTVSFSGETWALRSSCYANCDSSTAPPILNVTIFRVS